MYIILAVEELCIQNKVRNKKKIDLKYTNWYLK